MDEMKKQECKNIDLPEGFKITELGPLPEDWQVVRLGDELIEQKQKNRNEQSLPVYTISNVYGFILSDEFFEKQVYSRNLTNYKIVEKGDFAYNPYRVNVGSLALFRGDNPGLVSPAYTVFRVRSSDRLDPDFLLMLFKSSSLRSEIDRVAMSRGSVRRSLAYKDLSDFHIPLPPLPEQRAIAHVLRTVQRAKEATERVIQATRELKKSLMRYLFTYGPVSGEEAVSVPLKETEIGLVPEHWKVVRLGEIFEIQQGKALSPKSRIGSRMRPFLRTANILWGRVDLSNVDYMHFEESEEQRLALRVGDLLVCEGGDIGRTAIWNGQIQPCYYQNHLYRLRPNCSDVEPTFYMYWMETAWTILRLYGGAGNKTTIPNLSQSRLSSFPVPFPSLSEQRTIARVLRTVDKKLQVEEARKQALEELFKTLLHNLMIGKIRVKDVVLPNVGEGNGDATGCY